MNSVNVTAFLGRLLHGPTEDRPFAQTEYDSLKAYLIVCAILEPHDPPSVAGMAPRTISNAHATWLKQLAGIDRVAHIEDCEDFANGHKFKRLWLLSDWYDTATVRDERSRYYAQQSAEFCELRYRFWRVFITLRRQGVGEQASIDLLATLYEGHRLSVQQINSVLDGFGFRAPVTAEELTEFDKKLVRKEGHVYSSPIDFKGFEEDIATDNGDV